MYSSPEQFLPMMPGEHLLEPYLERASHVVNQASELGGLAHSATLASLHELLRSMNSYYSNRIEGQSTTPRNIDAALRHKFSDKPEIAQLQRIAVAHIEAEKDVEAQAAHASALNADFIKIAHRALYGRLAPEDRRTKDGLVVEPEKLREVDVSVGRHNPPVWQSLPRFMEAFTKHYDRPRPADARLIAIACAHHRMAWMHPFADGNGRATRLQTHAAMLPITKGVWSVNRGLARGVRDYYGYLAAADAPRQGDLDGRGNLTQKGLLQWVDYFLRVCEDQVAYMSDMLALDSMKAKINASVLVETAKGRLRVEAALPIYHLFAAGPTTRGEFIQMTGLGERTGRSLLSAALKCGLVASDTSHAPVRFAFPLDSLPILLPALYGAEE
ncbi:Fic family protein 1 [Achromobacter xylosoxidans A8]|uniref:Fic family protein 1 n=1 Tax=Achromobacter xylosoxidans (strain A8) TaxID=762376 RepID=E3HX51_ACHXA|nr:Fic family protein [Achromobacter xylosoxidans]ADP16405.1 Fic family protein 1 [Achromobacter xylosoxidans A8]